MARFPPADDISGRRHRVRLEQHRCTRTAGEEGLASTGADPGGRRAAELAQDGAGQLAVKDDVSKPAIWTPNEPSGGRHN
jgi:hypothetical protein